jgi:CheY-like chemotaxis protein
MPCILIADDEPYQRRLLAEVLGLDDPSLAFLLAANGTQVLDIARDEQPELIIMDVSMPRLDGVETFHVLQRDPVLQAIPVILITALGPGEIGHLRRVVWRATAFLKKPFEVDELQAVVQRALHGARAST